MEGRRKRFVIPVYQRNYNWKNEQCKPLVSNYNELGDIVLPNIPMDENGLLHLENARLYFKSIA